MSNVRKRVSYAPPSQQAKVGVPGAFRKPLAPIYDVPILEQLPKEGTKLGMIKPLAPTARHLSARFNGELTPGQISERLHSLLAHDAVVKVIVLPTSGGPGWQITPLGEQLLTDMKEETHG